MSKRRGRGAAVALLAGAAVAGLSGCGASHDVQRPRLVVLYATCTLAKSFLSPYDADVSWTPEIGRFAGRGVVFERHQTEAGLSGVAFASILSGAQATRHGVITHPTPLGDETLLLTEAFADAGFEVWFWSDHEMASPALGYAQGVPPAQVVAGTGHFTSPDPRRRHPGRESFLRADDPRFLRILDRLREDPDRRALVVTNFTVTHAPYASAWLAALCRDDPAVCLGVSEGALETAELFWREYVDLSWNFDATVRRLGLSTADVARIAEVAEVLYRANVHRLDRLFGDVVDAIDSRGLFDESAIAFTADHGEVHHRDGAIFRWNHGFALAPEVLGVPWLIASPGVAPGSWEGVTRSIDVFPTLAGLAGVPLPADAVEGVDLAPALRGEASAPALRAFSHTALVPDVLLRASRERGGTRLDALHPDGRGENIWASLRDGDRVFKLTRPHGPDGDLERSVYDLASDPTEQRNLYDPGDAAQQEGFEDLSRRRRAVVTRIDAAASDTPRLGDERSLEMLRRLGYVE